MNLVQFDDTPILEQALPIDFTVGSGKLGIYALETTQRHAFGRRYVTNAGEVFKYAKSNAAWRTGCLAMFGSIAGGTNSIDYDDVKVSQSIGDTQVVMLNGATAITENAMQNGHITINYLPPDSDNAYLQQRKIIGNSAAAIATNCTIYLDFPLDRALTAGVSYAFAMPSQYCSVGYVVSSGRSAAGVPAAYCSATGYFGWVQTWGQVWITDYAATLGKTAHQRQVVLIENCALGPHLYGTAQLTAQQHIGFIMDNNESANGSTVIFLQITPV